MSRGALMRFDIQRVRRFRMRAHGQAAAAGDGLRGGLLAGGQWRSYAGKTVGNEGSGASPQSACVR